MKNLFFSVTGRIVGFAEQTLEQRTGLSALVIWFMHGLILMTIAVKAGFGIEQTTAAFAIICALLWGPPIAWFASWLCSMLTWGTGRLLKGRVERSSILVLQSWASLPLFALWSVSLFDALFHPKFLRDMPDWIAYGLLMLSCLLILLSLTIYGAGLRSLYGLTVRNAIGRTIFSVLLNLIVAVLLVYAIAQNVNFNFAYWA